MGGLSAFHWLVVMVIVLLLFGNRLPSVMRSLGRGVVEFKKGMEGIEEELNSEPEKSEKAAVKAEKPAATSEAPKENPGK